MTKGLLAELEYDQDIMDYLDEHGWDNVGDFDDFDGLYEDELE